MKLKKVINLFGGPNTGKSVLACDLFTFMKKSNYNVELITEYAKDLTWEKRQNILLEDQLYIFAKQHRKLLRIKDNVEYAICDSPLILSGVYYNTDSNIYDKKLFLKLILDTFKQYPNLNFYLDRNLEFKYFEEGRNQTLEQAKSIDNLILGFLEDYNIPYLKFEPQNYDIRDYLMTKVL